LLLAAQMVFEKLVSCNVARVHPGDRQRLLERSQLIVQGTPPAAIEVRAELPDGRSRSGVAVDVDAGGQLMIKLDDGTPLSVSAADVVHLKMD